MAIEVRVEAGAVVVTKVGWTRRLGIAGGTLVGAVVLIAVAGGFSVGDIAGATAEGVFGLAMAAYVFSEATASIRADRTGLRYRSGIIYRRVAATDVVGIGLGRAGGPGALRIALVVARTAGRPKRIKMLSQLDTQKNRQALGDAGHEIVGAMCLAGVETQY